MIVRKYNSGHLGSFLRLVHSMGDERWVYDALDYQLIDRYYYSDYILGNEDYITLVAEDKVGDVIGFCVGTIRNESVDIMVLYVVQELRRKGFGRILKEQMTKQAYQLGKKSITAFNSYSNPASLQLNQTMGWTITSTGKDDGETASDHYKSELIFENKTIKQWDDISGATIKNPEGFIGKDAFLYIKRFSKKEYLTGLLYSNTQVNDREKWTLFNQKEGEK